MRGYIHSVHPAGAAIAAVLALSSTYSFAQEAPAPAPDAAAGTVIVPPAPVSPVVTPSQPMVQPTASVEDRLNAAVAASQAEAANRPSAPAEARVSKRATPAPVRVATRPEPVKAVPAQSVARSETPPVAAPANDPVPVPMTAASEAAPAVAAPVQADEARALDGGIDPALWWALGGGALLLAGLGGAAVVRRRRVRTEDGLVPVVAPVDVEPAPAGPTFMERAPLAEPIVNRAAIAVPVAAHGSSLDAMVAAPPSAENPFLTQRKRLVRARFLLAQREKGEQASAAARAPVPPQTIHAEPQMQTVYRMGADRNRRMTFKPHIR